MTVLRINLAATLSLLTLAGLAAKPILGDETDEKIEATAVAASGAEHPQEMVATPKPLPGPAAEEPAEFQRPPETHPWLRFSPGAWRTTIVTTQTLGPDGQTNSVAVTTQDETLASADGAGYVIRSRATLAAMGRVVEGAWVDSSYSALFDGTGNLVAQQRLPDESIVVDGRTVDCQVWSFEYDDGGRRRSDRIWFTAEVYPHVLMRQRLTLADNPADEPDRVETTEIVSTSMPFPVGDGQITCACLRTTTLGPKGRTVKVEVVSAAAPGGQVAAWATDWDVNDRRVRTVAVETVEYGTEPIPPTRRERRQLRRAAR